MFIDHAHQKESQLGRSEMLLRLEWFLNMSLLRELHHPISVVTNKYFRACRRVADGDVRVLSIQFAAAPQSASVPLLS